MATLILERIEKHYDGQHVVGPIDLNVAPGELVVVVGPSGCGKSTLLRMIAGLEAVSDGAIHIQGRNVTALPPVERGVAMVFQSYALYPHMTVEENIGFGLMIAGVSKTQRRIKVREAARILQLEPFLGRKPSTLSGGQRQRVAIGRAIVKQPTLFLFDEPLSNLDAELRQQTRLEIARLHQQLHATMIYVTHDQVEAMTLADRIVVLRAGRIEQIGTPMQLYRRPSNAFVGGFIGSPKMNFLEGQLVAGAGPGGAPEVAVPALRMQPFALQGLGELAAPGLSVTVGVRPEDLRICESSEGFAATVRLVEQLGNVAYIHVETAGAARLTVERRGSGSERIGDLLYLGLQPEALHLFDRAGQRL